MKNPVNLSFFLFFFVLVKLNLLLLNEESLILIVFIVFCILSTFKLSTPTSEFFEAQVNVIKLNYSSSDHKLIELFDKKQQTLTSSANWVSEFTKLQKHFQNFNIFTLEKLPNFYKLQIKNKVEKKFNFSKRLEQQVSKLISLIILEKLNKFILIQSFCTNTLILNKFITSEKIYLREHLTKI